MCRHTLSCFCFKSKYLWEGWGEGSRLFINPSVWFSQLHNQKTTSYDEIMKMKCFFWWVGSAVLYHLVVLCMQEQAAQTSETSAYLLASSSRAQLSASLQGAEALSKRKVRTQSTDSLQSKYEKTVHWGIKAAGSASTSCLWIKLMFRSNMTLPAMWPSQLVLATNDTQCNNEY